MSGQGLRGVKASSIKGAGDSGPAQAMSGENAGAFDLAGGVPVNVSGFFHQADNNAAHASGGQAVPAGAIPHGGKQGRTSGQVGPDGPGPFGIPAIPAGLHVLVYGGQRGR